MTDEFVLQKVIVPSLEKAADFLPNFSAATDLNTLVLYGDQDAILDSLNLVGFIFILEEVSLSVAKIEIKFTTEDILNKEASPFLNVKNLTAFLKAKLAVGKPQ